MSDTPKKSCRVYLRAHENGTFTAILMRQWNVFFDEPPPSAFGKSVEHVLEQLDVELARRAAAGTDPLERYLWSETFSMRSVTIDVRPQTFVDKRPVIGARAFPLTLQFAACQLKGGPWRVGLPRFGWWMVLEELELAKDALEVALGAALLGQQETLVYEFRRDGKELVREWTPRLVVITEDDDDEDSETTLRNRYPVMTEVADELVSKARAHKIHGIFGVWKDLNYTWLIDHPRSLTLVGPRGVGKSARVREWAIQASRKRKTPGEDDGVRRMWSTSKNRILAGMMFLGQWEERVLKMVEELRGQNDWLYVDRLADVIEPIGDHGSGSIGELLLPAVEAGEIKVVAEATHEEQARLRRRHPRWADAMGANWLYPPDDARLAEWVPQYAESAELRSGRLKAAAWQHDAMRRLGNLQGRFEPGQAQPGKAVRFVDWWVRTEPPTFQLSAHDITEAYARYTGLPIDMVNDRKVTTAESIQRELEARVVGQPGGAEVAAKVIARFKAGLNDPARPIGTLLFVGPTGVGKTELAKAMCQVMFGDEAKMIRLDMSEYHLPWSAERLFQLGRGVTSLAERVRQQPIALVLLDELEKAHPTIFDALMAVFDEGRFTDERGEVVDFRTTVIVMTSNLGAGGPRATGFGGAAATDYFGAARRFFRPELLNRIDHIVPFSHLDAPSIQRIVKLELARIVAREGLTRRGLRLVVSDALAERLGVEGYHPEYGARALRRVLEDRLVVPLAALLAQRPEVRDTAIHAGLTGLDVVFAIAGEVS